jgi:uncharacterized protein (DUF4415 family)
MTREQQSSKARRDGRQSANRTSPIRPTIRQRSADRLSPTKKPGRLDLRVSAHDRKRSSLAIANPEFYRPVKRPITLRLDADVLAWFKKDGRRYQTRINQALRQVMEREMKKS